MRKEESNKTNDSLVEKDMVVNEGIVWENGEIVFRKEGLKMFFFLCFCCVQITTYDYSRNISNLIILL